jgi:hypothetical protein
VIEDDFIDMMSGRMYLDDPKFDIGDIAHGLSLCCRFTGRIARFYSIAAHSLLVARVMREVTGGNPLEGLLHDAAEQAMSDLASPIKHRPELHGYRDFEHKLESALRTQFGLPPEKTLECHTADKYALYMEAYKLMPGGGKDWVDPHNVRQDALAWGEENGWPYLRWQEYPLDMAPRFLRAYKELTL